MTYTAADLDGKSENTLLIRFPKKMQEKILMEFNMIAKKAN